MAKRAQSKMPSIPTQPRRKEEMERAEAGEEEEDALLASPACSLYP